MQSLTVKYRPSWLSQVRGQDKVIHSLRSYLAAPYPEVFLFAGETGIGKTSAGYALAGELGVDIAEAELGGLFEIASGDLTKENVRETFAALRFCPLSGSGWRVLIANEVDGLHKQVEKTLLDILEHLPDRCAIVFTTNESSLLSDRFRGRCQEMEFLATGADSRKAVESLIADIWTAETGRPKAPDFRTLGLRETGPYDFRAALKKLQPFISRARMNAVGAA